MRNPYRKELGTEMRNNWAYLGRPTTCGFCKDIGLKPNPTSGGPALPLSFLGDPLNKLSGINSASLSLSEPTNLKLRLFGAQWGLSDTRYCTPPKRKINYLRQ